MAQLRQDYAEFVARGAEIVAIGPDSLKAFEDYWQKEQLPFVGLADPNHNVAMRYGQEVNLLKFGRMPALMVIDKEGLVRYRHYAGSMSDIPANSEILAVLDALQGEAWPHKWPQRGALDRSELRADMPRTWTCGGSEGRGYAMLHRLSDCLWPKQGYLIWLVGLAGLLAQRQPTWAGAASRLDSAGRTTADGALMAVVMEFARQALSESARGACAALASSSIGAIKRPVGVRCTPFSDALAGASRALRAPFFASGISEE